MKVLDCFRDATRRIFKNLSNTEEQNARAEILAAQNPRQLMHVLTDNPAWETGYYLASKTFFAELECEKLDRSILATVSALHRIGVDLIEHEKMTSSLGTGRTFMQTPGDQTGNVRVIAWLRPIQDAPEFAGYPLKPHFKDSLFYTKQRLIITMDPEMTFMKAKADEFRTYYKEAHQEEWHAAYSKLNSAITFDPRPAQLLAPQARFS